eukprot:1208679-Rhodomonas_salina.2
MRATLDVRAVVSDDMQKNNQLEAFAALRLNLAVTHPTLGSWLTTQSRLASLLSLQLLLSPMWDLSC